MFNFKFRNKQKNKFYLLIIVSFVTLLLPFQKVLATTGFARQTGEPCSSCHMQAYGPWLTQYGQKFKLDGYVAGNANKLPNLINALGVEVVGSLTNTNTNVPKGTYDAVVSGNAKTNNNLEMDWISIYYTGRVAPKAGAYLQMQMTPSTTKAISLSMADLRAADHHTLLGKNVTYGVTATNAPTMSDFWMSSYAWMYPYTQSQVATMPTAKPWMQGLMGSANSAGMTAYAMVDNHVYVEVGGYTSQSSNMAQGLGTWGNGGKGNPGDGYNYQSGQIQGGAPYYRTFVQHITGPHTMMVGSFGMAGNVTPSYVAGAGSNAFQEFNFDTNYSYMMDNNNMFMGMARYTRDNMTLNASQSMGLSTNNQNNLNSMMMMGMWTYKQTYNLSAMWNYMKGTTDMGLYNGGATNVADINPISGSANGSPNSNYFMLGADYVPFGKGTVKTDPYTNLRFSLNYYAYTQFNGASNNYDGQGRSATQNNTLYLVGNWMF